jgi:type I restriction enzyme S subunit
VQSVVARYGRVARDYLAFQKALHRVRPRDAVDARFLRYLLEHHSVSGVLAGLSTGTTIAHLPQQQLRRVPVPVPPLDEQRRIVDVLEGHLSRLDAADTYLRSTRRRLITLERSALESLFGGAEVPLAELISNISAGKSFGGMNGPAGDGAWGIIKVSAMTWGAFDPSENKAIPSDRVDLRFEVREGDLLVSRANTDEYVGASVLVGPVRPRLLLSDKSLRVVPVGGVRTDWLWRALQAPSARRQISAMATGTKASMRNISQESLKRVRVPCATGEEQAAAVASFAEIATVIDRLRTELRGALVRSRSLRRWLLAAAFSGQLSGLPVDRSVVDETANE